MRQDVWRLPATITVAVALIPVWYLFTKTPLLPAASSWSRIPMPMVRCLLPIYGRPEKWGPSITPNGPGVYCVTFTDGNGCVATACYDYLGSGANNYNICGYVFPPDSTLIGSTTVSLYLLENSGATFVAEQRFQGESFGWTYNFDNLLDGTYIVRAEIDPGALGSADYAPTYSYSELLWDDADVISIPNNATFCNTYIELIPESGANGSGEIIGSVLTGSGAFMGSNDLTPRRIRKHHCPPPQRCQWYFPFQ